MLCTKSQDTCSQSKGMVCANLSVTKPFGVDLFGVGSSPTAKAPSSLNDAFFSAMKFIGLHHNQDASPGCYSMSSLISGISAAVFKQASALTCGQLPKWLIHSYVQIYAISHSATFLKSRFCPLPSLYRGSFASQYCMISIDIVIVNCCV